jgi:hypothetical protein
LNSCENYPEFPLTLDALKINKPHQNVWKNWIDDNAESLNIACNNDISNKNFDIDAMIKDADQRRLIYQAFIDNFQLI